MSENDTPQIAVRVISALGWLAGGARYRYTCHRFFSNGICSTEHSPSAIVLKLLSRHQPENTAIFFNSIRHPIQYHCNSHKRYLSSI